MCGLFEPKFLSYPAIHSHFLHKLAKNFEDALENEVSVMNVRFGILAKLTLHDNHRRATSQKKGKQPPRSALAFPQSDLL
jgi:hypothetical protein